MLGFCRGIVSLPLLLVLQPSLPSDNTENDITNVSETLSEVPCITESPCGRVPHCPPHHGRGGTLRKPRASQKNTTQFNSSFLPLLGLLAGKSRNEPSGVNSCAALLHRRVDFSLDQQTRPKTRKPAHKNESRRIREYLRHFAERPYHYRRSMNL